MRISLPSTVLSLKTVTVDLIAPPLKELSMWLRQALKISSSVFKCLQLSQRKLSKMDHRNTC